MSAKKELSYEQLLARYNKARKMLDEFYKQIEDLHREARKIKNKLRKEIDTTAAKEILEKIK